MKKTILEKENIGPNSVSCSSFSSTPGILELLSRFADLERRWLERCVLKALSGFVLFFNSLPAERGTWYSEASEAQQEGEETPDQTS